MQNKPNFRKSQMNVSSVLTMNYENKSNWTLGENKPNSNPNKPNLKIPHALRLWKNGMCSDYKEIQRISRLVYEKVRNAVFWIVRATTKTMAISSFLQASCWPCRHREIAQCPDPIAVCVLTADRYYRRDKSLPSDATLRHWISAGCGS